MPTHYGRQGRYIHPGQAMHSLGRAWMRRSWDRLLTDPIYYKNMAGVQASNHSFFYTEANKLLVSGELQTHAYRAANMINLYMEDRAVRLRWLFLNDFARLTAADQPAMELDGRYYSFLMMHHADRVRAVCAAASLHDVAWLALLGRMTKISWPYEKGSELRWHSSGDNRRYKFPFEWQFSLGKSASKSHQLLWIASSPFDRRRKFHHMYHGGRRMESLQKYHAKYTQRGFLPMQFNNKWRRVWTIQEKRAMRKKKANPKNK
eukprot:NODE_2190_length_1117_cov_103.711111_g2172_i0.p1 GENE.NODE_2190_length_1117_cov_103.711111_g2172_i0~~NODE_2190_length_1117_cov_103.711111_g2172_i0.p1  ORF type:complete len:262 (+),score=48.96 NODE_2190_length_1117_cov_103.711111_g2172_i0:122-907(+)